MPAQQESWIATAYLQSGTISAGAVACLNAAGTQYLPATLFNRTAAGRPAACIALSAADAENSEGAGFEAQYVGVVPPSISGLGAGSATYVTVSDLGYLARTSTLDSSVVGKCDADGTAYVSFPLASVGSGGGFTSPTGTGFAHVTSSALDAASKKVDLTASADITAPGATGDIPAKLSSGALGVVGYWSAVDNAGKLRATYWDSDGTTLRGALQISAGAFYPTEQIPSSGFLRFSSALLNITDWPIATVYSTALAATRTFISFVSGGPLFGDRNGDLPTQIYGSSVTLVAGASITLSAFGGDVGVSTPFHCADVAAFTRLVGYNTGTVNTSGLSLDASTIVTSGGTTPLSSAQAATLLLVITGTGGTLTAPDRAHNVYFIDATGCSGAVTINDGTAGGVTVAAGKYDIVIHDGTNYESALSNAAGGMTAADKTKLDGMQPEGSAVTVSAMAIDWSAGSVFTKTLAAGANTFTFSNATSGRMITVRVTGAASTLTWPTVKWAGGVAPTQTASGTDVYTFVHDGTNIYGSVVQAMS